MIRFCSLRLAAALFTLCLCAFATAPASAGGTRAAAAPTESGYAAVLRTINPKLPLQKARAYARSVLADAWRTHLDPRFIMSIVTVESMWRSNALSRVGARGLGQLMPHTAALLGVNAWNPAENLRGTSSYLKTLMDHFAGKPNATKLAIAGYNAGPKAVERYHGVPPYTETRNYVVRVLHVWKQLDARVGRAFAPAVVTLAVRPHPLPDERQWLSNVNEVLPATAAAVDSVPNPALSADSDARSEMVVNPSVSPEPK
jgi:soluble lytic murein transglycosylase-like protein